jgi:hypothetical protein
MDLIGCPCRQAETASGLDGVIAKAVRMPKVATGTCGGTFDARHPEPRKVFGAMQKTYPQPPLGDPQKTAISIPL